MLLQNQSRAQFEREVERQFQLYREQKLKHGWEFTHIEQGYGDISEVKIVNKNWATIVRFHEQDEILITKELSKRDIDELEMLFFKLQD